jgi:hypothetical protein
MERAGFLWLQTTVQSLGRHYDAGLSTSLLDQTKGKQGRKAGACKSRPIWLFVIEVVVAGRIVVYIKAVKIVFIIEVLVVKVFIIVKIVIYSQCEETIFAFLHIIKD